MLDSYRVEVSLKALFELPRVADFAQNIEKALYQASSHMDLPLAPVSRGSNLPASFGQRALWFHDQLDSKSCGYNLLFSYRLSGELDVHLLERSINQIIARHEVLRTVFEAADGQLVQHISPRTLIGLHVIDLSNVASESLQDSGVRRYAGALARQPFDLARGPLLRSALLRLAKNEHVFLLAVHHIVFDGWSIGIFLRELSQIYNSLKSGKPFQLAELSIQYADFAIWQRERLRDANLESSLSYWKNQLDNLPTLILPIKRVHPIPERSSGGREEFLISDKLLNLLRSEASRSGTTLFMVLLAAWKVALHRYTGQTDIAIGTPVAGRNHPAVEELIGYFLNLVVLRSDLSGDPTFRELLERIRQVCIDAFAHQHLPFEKLVEELQPTRHATTNPLVQATFALQNTPKQSLNLTGIAARDLDISAGVGRPFDLHLYVVEEATGLRAYVNYNESSFETDTIKRLIPHLKNLLEAIAADPNERISALPMLAKQEKNQLLVEWNDTAADYPKDRCIHELFEAQVERTPEAVAVVFEDQKLTYRELNKRANQLAHHLQTLRVGPEVLVGICMERSVEMVVGLLGILKAGGAYVPLDPTYPKERLGFMLNDSQTPLLLTQKHLVQILPDCPTQVLCLDTDWNRIGEQRDGNPFCQTRGGNAAYMIYTSGSTGIPKGVVNVHGGLRNRLQWMQEAYRLTAADRVLQKTPFTFDVSVWEFFWPLISGAGLVMARPEGHRDSEYLIQLIKSQRITTLHFVPSMLAVFLRETGVEEPLSIGV